MKLTTTIAITGLGIALGTCSVAPAFAQAPATNDDSMRGPVASDSNLRTVRNDLDRLIDQLQNDKHDYAGFRVISIKDLQSARADLQTALGKDASNPGDPPMHGAGMPNDPKMDDPAHPRTEAGSDRNIAHVADRVSALIDQLQGDKHDYHGYRVIAIRDLQKARTDLQSAASHDTSDSAAH